MSIIIAIAPLKKPKLGLPCLLWKQFVQAGRSAPLRLKVLGHSSNNSSHNGNKSSSTSSHNGAEGFSLLACLAWRGR